MKKLTVKQAIEEGYSHWGYKDREYQCAQNLEDIVDDDFNTDETLVLFEKEPFYRSISASEIQDLIFDYMYDNDETSDDTEFMSNNFSQEDFKPLADFISKKFDKNPYYWLTDIELTK